MEKIPQLHNYGLKMISYAIKVPHNTARVGHLQPFHHHAETMDVIRREKQAKKTMGVKFNVEV